MVQTVDVKMPIQFHSGELDAHNSPEAVDALKQRFAGKDAPVFT
jgi:carboxymethylenebutenolidase